MRRIQLMTDEDGEISRLFTARLRDVIETIRRKCCSVTIWLATSVALAITSISVRMEE